MLSKLTSTALRIRYGLFSKAPSVDIVAALANTRNILVYMPEKVDQFGSALKALEQLRKLRPHWKISVITHLDMVSFFDKKLKFDLMPYSKNDINLWGLPKQSFKRLVETAEFDLAMDMQLDFSLMSIVLFLTCKSPLRVSFDAQAKSPFYNLGIRVNAAESLKNKYNAMIKYITIIPEPPQNVETVKEV